MPYARGFFVEVPDPRLWNEYEYMSIGTERTAVLYEYSTRTSSRYCLTVPYCTGLQPASQRVPELTETTVRRDVQTCRGYEYMPTSAVRYRS